MPRDSGGTYTLPSGNPVVSGTVIASSWANNTMPDLGNEMTDSLSRSGNGAMLAALKHIDGAETSPSQTFNNDPLTGRYLAAVSDMRDTVAGVDKMRLTAAGLEVWIDPDWVPVIYGDGGYKPYKKNYLINGGFDEAQRGSIVSPTNLDYTLDRWFISNQTGTFTVSQTSFNGPDSRGNIYNNANAMAVASTAGSTFSIAQRIEGLDNMFGQTVTVSFAVRVIGTVIAQEVTQVAIVNREGSTGQGAVNLLATPIAISGDMVWYEATGVIPSYEGGNNTYTSTELVISFGGINNTDRVDILAVQLEEGSSATSFEYVSPQENLAACQRYYWNNTGSALSLSAIGTPSGSYQFITYIPYPVTLRTAATPSILTSTLGNNATAIAVNSGTKDAARIILTLGVGAVGGTVSNLTYEVSAEL